PSAVALFNDSPPSPARLFPFPARRISRSPHRLEQFAAELPCDALRQWRPGIRRATRCGKPAILSQSCAATSTPSDGSREQVRVKYTPVDRAHLNHTPVLFFIRILYVISSEIPPSWQPYPHSRSSYFVTFLRDTTTNADCSKREAAAPEMQIRSESRAAAIL
ncbi:unnamed protein product, partial [Closterium sp. NIES-54]